MKATGITLEHRAFRYSLEMSLEGYQYPLEYLPLSQMNNIFMTMTEIIRDYQKIGTHNELKRFRRRMREFRTAADSQVRCLLEGMQRGIVLPRVIAEQVQKQLDTLLRDKPYLKTRRSKQITKGLPSYSREVFHTGHSVYEDVYGSVLSPHVS